MHKKQIDMFLKILNCIKYYSEKTLRNRYKKQFSISQGLPEFNVEYRNQISLLDFYYFDQNERVVKNLTKYFFFKHFFIPFDERVEYATNKKVIATTTNQYKVCSKGLQNDWIYMVAKEVPENYKLSFNITLLSEFKEFQVAFRHTNLFKRLRFRIVDTNTIVFEIVNRGVFFNSFITKNYDFKLGQKYNIQVVVYNKKYILLIDNIIELFVTSTSNDFKSGDMAIVFWDDKDKSNINATVDSLCIYEIL